MRIIIYVFTLILMLINMGFLAYLAIHFYKFLFLWDNIIIPVIGLIITLTAFSIVYAIYLFECAFHSSSRQNSVPPKRK